MKVKQTFWMSLIATLILSTLAVRMLPVQASTPAGALALSPETIYVEKDNETVTLPSWPYFDVNVTITNVTDIVGAVFSIHWDPTILNLTDIVGCPPFYIAGYPDYLLPTGAGGISGLMKTVNYTEGNLKQAAQVQLYEFSKKTFTAPNWGWVAKLTFEFIGTPPSAGSINTNITIVDNPGALMATEWTPDGVIWNKFQTLGTCEFTYAGPPAEGGDVAVTNVVPAKDQVYPTWTVPLNITVTVLNNGTEPANCTVAAYYVNATAAYQIGTLPVTNLAASAEMNLTFSWTLSVDWGLYTIKANATLEGDINLANNELVDGTVKVKMPGDIDGNGEVKGLDLSYFADAWWSVRGVDENYNQECDFDNNGEVKGLDLTYFANYWWQTTDKY